MLPILSRLLLFCKIDFHAEQVTSIDKSRLTELRGHIRDHGIMAKVTAAIQIQIGAISNK